MGTQSYPVIDLAATGANIVRLRKERGYSVTDLQEFFGFEAPQAIYKWQQGKTLPSTDNLFALSVFLGVTIEEILVAEKPKFQVLPQEESCGSFFCLFGRTLPGFYLFRIVSPAAPAYPEGAARGIQPRVQ